MVLYLELKQIGVGKDNFSYIIYSKKDNIAAIVDPGFEPEKTIRVNFEVWDKELGEEEGELEC